MALHNNARRIDAPDFIGAQLPSKARLSQRYDQRKLLTVEIVCVNGLSFGVRVGKQYACLPKSDKGPWTHVELIGPNRTLSALERYRAETTSTLYTAYHEVPIELLNQLIARNGGVK